MLVDWMLPDMSGLELTRSLKRAKDTEEIPVIMLTARTEEQDKVGGLEGGADDSVTKLYNDGIESYKKGIALNDASKKPSPADAGIAWNSIGNAEARLGKRDARRLRRCA